MVALEQHLPFANHTQLATQNRESRIRVGDSQPPLLMDLIVCLFSGGPCRLLQKGKSEHPESNQGPFDICAVYSRTLYQLSYVRVRYQGMYTCCAVTEAFT